MHLHCTDDLINNYSRSSELLLVRIVFNNVHLIDCSS